MFSTYIEFEDGRVTLKEGLTKLQAKRWYNKYSKQPDAGAKEWGWLTADEYKLSYEILQNRAMRSA